MRRTMAMLMLMAAIPAAAKPPADPKDAADRFQLDLAPGDEDATVTASEAPSAEARPESPKARFSLDTPIAELLANYQSKAVLDKDMPGLSTDKNLDKFKSNSLNQLAPLSGGRLDEKLLAKVGKHLAAIE